jgi:hypothetical protein
MWHSHVQIDPVNESFELHCVAGGDGRYPVEAANPDLAELAQAPLE